MEWIDSAWDINNEGKLIWIRNGKSKRILAGQPTYCGLQDNGYMVCRTSTKPRRTLKAHHLVWYFTTGEWPTQPIDHIDGNRSNNSITNLRLTTREQNLCNRKPTKNRILPKGVNKGYKNNYSAVITISGKRIYLGYFKTVEEAAQAYREASIRLQKEFSYYISQGVI